MGLVQTTEPLRQRINNIYSSWLRAKLDSAFNEMLFERLTRNPTVIELNPEPSGNLM